ncbi:MAG: ROK family protein [Candidatus Rokubacteria bacterium]|nr:ROK family protein [Candidatus Rokubacteria bacterium]
MGAVGADGQILSKLERLTDARRGPAAVIATVRSAVDEVRASIGAIAGLGVACAGQVRSEDGLVVQAPNLGWHDVPLGARLTETFGIPVVIENDVRAAAWGEFRFGAGRGLRSLIAVFVGTGLGSGAVLDGQLWRGAGNAAGEVGHTQVVIDGLPCRCGQRGCLEQYVSGNGFQRRFDAALAASVKTRLVEPTDGDPAKLTAPMVWAAAAGGDVFAREVVRDAERYLALGIANYVTALNPAMLVFGGGVVETVPALLEVAVPDLLARTTVLARASLRIERARLGDWSGVVGAAALAGSLSTP